MLYSTYKRKGFLIPQINTVLLPSFPSAKPTLPSPSTHTPWKLSSLLQKQLDALWGLHNPSFAAVAPFNCILTQQISLELIRHKISKLARYIRTISTSFTLHCFLDKRSQTLQREDSWIASDPQQTWRFASDTCWRKPHTDHTNYQLPTNYCTNHIWATAKNDDHSCPLSPHIPAEASLLLMFLTWEISHYHSLVWLEAWS